MKTCKNITKLLVAIIFILVNYGCKKSNLNPNCWGEKQEAVFFPPSSLCGAYILLDSNQYIIRNKIPKEFLEADEPISVLINYKLVDAKPKVPPCGGEKDIRIKCIQIK
jgi:hypothetical protein